MDVKLIAHTKLSYDFWLGLSPKVIERSTDGQVVALTAIRTCYSPNKPSEIVELEGEKYFCNDAADGEGGSDADRLFRHITRSSHTSTLEHLNYTFAVEGVSRSLLAQLTRHRHFSFSVQSQRYVKLGSDDRIGGFDYVTPTSVDGNKTSYAYLDGDGNNAYTTAEDTFNTFMEQAQEAYDSLRSMGIPAEDARFVLPNAATCNLVMTANLRSLLEFYKKRQKGRGAQWEISDLAEAIWVEVVKVDPWADAYFNEV